MNVTGPEWRKLTAEELRLLSTIAFQVGMAIERARLAEDAMGLARAEERARIAREIHDTLAQGLTAIALNIEGAMHRLETDPDQARERLERALAMARENLEDARRSVLDLRGAAQLEGKPLAEALAGLARAFTSDTGIPATVQSSNVDGLSLRIESEVFRIAQEALTNVRKHARAHSVQIGLRATWNDADAVGARRRARVLVQGATPRRRSGCRGDARARAAARRTARRSAARQVPGRG